MNFSNNHKLHLIITILFITLCSSFLYIHLNKTRQISIDSNRIATARLMHTAIEAYNKELGLYPEQLDDIVDFINPVPIDIKTKKYFKYTKTELWFTLTIPQDTKDDFVFQK